MAPPQVTLDPEPVQRGPLLWTWDGVLGKGFMLGAFPVRMVIAGYTLGGKTLLVVISPLEPTEAVVSWVSECCRMHPHCSSAALCQLCQCQVSSVC